MLPSLMPDTIRADLEATWAEREQEAAHLKSGGFRSMSLALRCYALEIRLKAIICQHLGLEFLPKVCKTHDYLDLVIFTGLWADLSDPANAPIQRNWDLLVLFNKQRLNDLRYRRRTDLEDDDADVVDRALDDPQYGVLAWLSKPR